MDKALLIGSSGAFATQNAFDLIEVSKQIAVDWWLRWWCRIERVSDVWMKLRNVEVVMLEVAFE
jgi:hypothetical protein